MAWTERYISVAGGGAHDGTSEADAWTLAEAIAAPYAAGQRLNVKAGTYANTTTGRTFSVAGSTTAPIWWRGYNTTIGDIDSDNTLTKPLITFTDALFLVSGAHQIFSNLSISGARTAGNQVNITAGMVKFDRVRVENTNAAAASGAVNSLTTAANRFTRCWFKATGTATAVVTSSVMSGFTGCVFEGGGFGLSSTNAITCMFCVFNNTGGDGIRQAAVNSFIVTSCTFYSCGGDGIEISTLPATTTEAIITNCIFSECGGYGINNSSGANTNIIHRAHNLFHSNSSGTENGFGDSPAFSDQTDATSPFTNGAGSDLSLVSTTTAKATGIPRGFENQSYTGYLDIGAVQREEPAGGGLPSPNRIIQAHTY